MQVMEPASPVRGAALSKRLCREDSDEKENMPHSANRFTLLGEASPPAKKPRITFSGDTSSFTARPEDKTVACGSLGAGRAVLRPCMFKEDVARDKALSLRSATSASILGSAGAAAATVHAAATRPHHLVARERECGELDTFLDSCLGSATRPGTGGCLYVSGGPGTGKTCSVKACVAALRHRLPGTKVVELNCMDISQRSPAGLLRRILQDCGCAQTNVRTVHGLLAGVADALTQLGGPVVLVVDEVDQMVRRSGGRPISTATGVDFDAFLSLPRLLCALPLALIAIANAVDLLSRSGIAPTPIGHDCASLLFEPYTAVQLKSIVRARLAKSDKSAEAENALGAVRLELKTRQVAKMSGDCRRVLSLCEEALFETDAERISELSRGGDAMPSSQAELGVIAARTNPRQKTSCKQTHNDPLRAVQQLPSEQQVVLCALAHANHEAARVSDICARYKEFCKKLHQPLNFASKGHVLNALEALEQRGLLEFRKSKGAHSPGGNKIVELAVSREAVRESIVHANPLLERCLS